MRKVVLAGLALAVAAPLAAQAQVVIQAPPVVGPGYVGAPPPPPGPYWRGPGEYDWRRREEIREEYRRAEWRRDHCVRDFRGEVFCRR